MAVGLVEMARDDRAFARLEAAILMIAFVVVAALFTYFLVKADLFLH